MFVRGALLRFLLRQTLPGTLAAALSALVYVLLDPGVLDWRCRWPALFVLAHSCFVTVAVGRSRSGAFAFTYTRGYSRDCLWAHAMMASAMSVAAVWLPAAVTVWTGLRSSVQDTVFMSQDFPVMATREAGVPVAWLLGYTVLLPTFHYAWIRSSQPTRGRNAGLFLSAGVVVGVFAVTATNPRAEWFRWFACAGCVAVGAIMLIAGRRLHRRLEVEA